jgi:hypothetical protein
LELLILFHAVNQKTTVLDKWHARMLFANKWHSGGTSIDFSNQGTLIEAG